MRLVSPPPSFYHDLKPFLESHNYCYDFLSCIVRIRKRGECSLSCLFNVANKWMLIKVNLEAVAVGTLAC